MSSKFPIAPKAPLVPFPAERNDTPVLSSGFRKALGNEAPGFSEEKKSKRGAELARIAKAAPSGPAKPTSGRKAHIGPRSGHK